MGVSPHAHHASSHPFPSHGTQFSALIPHPSALSSCAHHQAAVDGEHGSVHELRGVGGEPDVGVGDVVRFAETGQGCVSGHVVDHFLRHGPHHLRADEAGGD